MIGDGLVSAIRIADGAGGMARSRLVLGGVETAFDVPGAVLEAAFAVGDENLLFLTDDVPFEEGLSICLVDQVGKLQDHVTMAAAGATGTLHAVRRMGSHQFAFSFFPDMPLQVTVLTRPRIILPRIGLRTGIHRPFSLNGRLIVVDFCK